MAASIGVAASITTPPSATVASPWPASVAVPPEDDEELPLPPDEEELPAPEDEEPPEEEELEAAPELDPEELPEELPPEDEDDEGEASDPPSAPVETGDDEVHAVPAAQSREAISNCFTIGPFRG